MQFSNFITINLSVLGLRGKVFVAGGAAGVASVRRHQELPPCWTEPVTVGSKTELAKVEPINDAGGTSKITYLRKKRVKNTAQRL